MKTFRFSILFALSILLTISSCSPKGGDEEGSPPAATVAVQLAPVTEGEAVLTVTAFGKTDALRREKVYAPLTGKLVSLKAFEGTEVRTGDVLALIQTKESQATILGAEGMLEAARTPEQKAEAKRAVELARAMEHTVRVLARFDGAVGSRLVSEGELVAENTEMFTIVDLASVNFLADIPLHDVSSIKVDLVATIQFHTLEGKTFPAVVEAISPQADQGSQTVKVRLRFGPMPESSRSLLRTDMIGTAAIVVGKRSHALFVPKASLLRNDENNTYTVVTMTADSLALHVPVAVGVVGDSTAEVQSPALRKGAVVVTVGAYALADSTHITVAPTVQE